MNDHKTLDQMTSDDLDQLHAERDQYRAAILDIDAHATPVGLANPDDPDGNPHHYAVTVGALHRALGKVGHTAPLCTAEAERDGAYRERAHLLALLAALHPSVIAPAPDVDEPGWQILYLQIGGRQASWHIAPRDAELFAHVEHVPADDRRAQWDGHTTEEKYAHIGEHAARLYAEARGRVETPLAEEAEAIRQMDADPHGLKAGMVVQPYREYGQEKWVFRCWGTDDGCEGLLSLDHTSKQGAERARDRHVAEDHQPKEA